MTARQLPLGWVIGVVALLLLILLPLALSAGQLSLPTEVLLFAMFAITYDLIFGFTGLISFGQALFIGCGAYALAISMTNHGLAFWPALGVVLISGIVISAFTGLLALRTHGVYFAMVTLAFAQAAFTLAESNVGNLTNGENGLGVTGAPSWLTGPGSGTHFYYVALVALVGTYLLLHQFVSSPAGRVWQAVRDNEQRALMVGYHPFQFKLLSYVIAGTVASLVGALYALFIGTVTTTLFTADLTIQLLLMVIIGGAGSLWGAIVGAAVVRYLNHYLVVFSGSSLVTSLPDWMQKTLGQPLLLFGCIYLLLVYFFPQGVAGLIQRYSIFGPRLLPAGAGTVGLGEVEGKTAVSSPQTPIGEQASALGEQVAVISDSTPEDERSPS